mmetsp:Transcript_4359/g.11980  ORF Transcript_4359/g.11980 Transcript_4359/m.11980 type:complete len:260 (+) Transcript_4359:283-1062(+)
MFHQISHGIIDAVTHGLSAHPDSIGSLPTGEQASIETGIDRRRHVGLQGAVHFRQDMLSLPTPFHGPSRGFGPFRAGLLNHVHHGVAVRANETVFRPNANLKAPLGFQPFGVGDAVLFQVNTVVLLLLLLVSDLVVYCRRRCHYRIAIVKHGRIQHIFVERQVGPRFPCFTLLQFLCRKNGKRRRMLARFDVNPKARMGNVQFLVRVERGDNAMQSLWMVANELRNALGIVVRRRNGQTAAGMKVVLTIDQNQSGGRCC